MHSGQNFGIFGHMQMSPQNQQFSNINEKLTVVHEEEKFVKLGGDSFVDIRYSAPFRFQRIKLEFVASEDLELLSDDTVNLPLIRGNLSLGFQALSSGKHFILVNISATENGKDYFAQQRIMVNAS
jgi:hypothetical protein